MNRIGSPKEKYINDPEYNFLVDTLEKFIEQARFTPSEIREACILACINYEMRHIRDYHIDPSIENACKILDEFIHKRNSK